MNIAIVGSGIIGLTLARHILLNRSDCKVTIFDFQGFPSPLSSSTRNSSVLHAGLYYKPNSLKLSLCLKGRALLQNFCVENNLPLLSCGKLLVPFREEDYSTLQNIYNTAKQNQVPVSLLDHNHASSIQPSLRFADQFLWSPSTSVFDSLSVVNTILKDLLKLSANLYPQSVQSISCLGDRLTTSDGFHYNYDFIFNVAGPNSLPLFRTCSDSLNHLFSLPFKGQYATLNSGPSLFTNLYPVPDLSLPFLGIHLTPRATSAAPILGPNALPSFTSFPNILSRNDFRLIPSRLLFLLGLISSNMNNFRQHSFNEFTLNPRRHFHNCVSNFLTDSSSSIRISMEPSLCGIRSQLIDSNSLEFINDFLVETVGTSLHVVNAVSPAFTSSMALAEYLFLKSGI